MHIEHEKLKKLRFKLRLNCQLLNLNYLGISSKKL